MNFLITACSRPPDRDRCARYVRLVSISKRIYTKVFFNILLYKHFILLQKTGITLYLPVILFNLRSNIGLKLELYLEISFLKAI